MASEEQQRLTDAREGNTDWKKWGTYLSERQWGTVREDYSEDGAFWASFPHDHARSRTYRWGEDGLMGFTNRECQLCFKLALWNERDSILKERLFGLSSIEGNHGEDVKECYYYLDNTPTHSYAKGLYKYPQSAFPYQHLVKENKMRSSTAPEYELLDTGIFDDKRYFDVFVEYAKAGPDDILIRIRAHNRGPESAPLHILPTLWFRNTWAWGNGDEDETDRPEMALERGALTTRHEMLQPYRFHVEKLDGAHTDEWLFTENRTNRERLFNEENYTDHVKDAFHRHIVHNEEKVVNPDREGTKATRHLGIDIPAGEHVTVRARLVARDQEPDHAFNPGFNQAFDQRKEEADAFYDQVIPDELDDEEEKIDRQAYAGLLWTKQFYFYDVKRWSEGDRNFHATPEDRVPSRNEDWTHLYNRDIISMPDKWEFPWYAVWDLAFHMIPFSRLDPEFAKQQLSMFLTERYMHPNGAVPAYEIHFSDANPPVYAWAVWRVSLQEKENGNQDLNFLASCFQKLSLNFNWWVNRTDEEGNHIFSGGFLGLDNIGVFDRGTEFSDERRLEQADATAWVAFYAGVMLQMALELSQEADGAYEEMTKKFYDHYLAITDAFNDLGGTGLWSDEDEFYYDHINADGELIPLHVRSLVGLMPLIAARPIEEDAIQSLPGLKEHISWLQTHRRDVIRTMTCEVVEDGSSLCNADYRLLGLPTRERLESILTYMFDEDEFLAPFGIRSLSQYHDDHPYRFELTDEIHEISYTPGEAEDAQYGGNSNWRGPIWFPINYLLIESLERYHRFYQDSLTAEFPTGSGNEINMKEAAIQLSDQLVDLFRKGEDGQRPCHGDERIYAEDPHWNDLFLFYENFHGNTGRGCGASHQTGWTALVTQCLEKVARRRSDES